MQNSVAIHNNKPSASIEGARLYRYCIPFSKPMLFNKEWLTQRQGFIVELSFSDGTKGYGEAAPLKGFSRESLSECEQLLRRALKQLSTTGRINIIPSAALFALDCALDKTPYQFQPTSSANIPLLVGDTPAILAKYQALHCPEQVKLKVARNTIEHDVKNIEALLTLNNKTTFNLDANKAWSVEQATEFSTRIQKHAINYIEEPCYSLSESLTFSKNTGIGIALDESLQDESFVFSTHSAIKALIIKPSIIGCFKRCRQLIEQANKANIASYLSSAYESSFGISQLQYLAKTWTPNQPSGFDTLAPLTRDIISDSGRNVPLLHLKDLTFICQY